MVSCLLLAGRAHLRDPGVGAAGGRGHGGDALADPRRPQRPEHVHQRLLLARFGALGAVLAQVQRAGGRLGGEPVDVRVARPRVGLPRQAGAHHLGKPPGQLRQLGPVLAGAAGRQLLCPSSSSNSLPGHSAQRAQRERRLEQRRGRGGRGGLRLGGLALLAPAGRRRGRALGGVHRRRGQVVESHLLGGGGQHGGGGLAQLGRGAAAEAVQLALRLLGAGLHRVVPAVLPLGQRHKVLELLVQRRQPRSHGGLHGGRKLAVVGAQVVQDRGQRRAARALLGGGPRGAGCRQLPPEERHQLQASRVLAQRRGLQEGLDPGGHRPGRAVAGVHDAVEVEPAVVGARREPRRRALQQPPPGAQLQAAPPRGQRRHRPQLRAQGDVLGGGLLPHLGPRQQELQPGEQRLERGGGGHAQHAVRDAAELQQHRVVWPLAQQLAHPRARRLQGRLHQDRLLHVGRLHVGLLGGGRGRAAQPPRQAAHGVEVAGEGGVVDGGGQAQARLPQEVHAQRVRPLKGRRAAGVAGCGRHCCGRCGAERCAVRRHQVLQHLAQDKLPGGEGRGGSGRGGGGQVGGRRRRVGAQPVAQLLLLLQVGKGRRAVWEDLAVVHLVLLLLGQHLDGAQLGLVELRLLGRDPRLLCLDLLPGGQEGQEDAVQAIGGGGLGGRRGGGRGLVGGLVQRHAQQLEPGDQRRGSSSVSRWRRRVGGGAVGGAAVGGGRGGGRSHRLLHAIGLPALPRAGGCQGGEGHELRRRLGHPGARPTERGGAAPQGQPVAQLVHRQLHGLHHVAVEGVLQREPRRPGRRVALPHRRLLQRGGLTARHAAHHRHHPAHARQALQESGGVLLERQVLRGRGARRGPPVQALRVPQELRLPRLQGRDGGRLVGPAGQAGVLLARRQLGVHVPRQHAQGVPPQLRVLGSRVGARGRRRQVQAGQAEQRPDLAARRQACAQGSARPR
jgi:hypothetical protein